MIFPLYLSWHDGDGEGAFLVDDAPRTLRIAQAASTLNARRAAEQGTHHSASRTILADVGDCVAAYLRLRH